MSLAGFYTIFGESTVTYFIWAILLTIFTPVSVLVIGKMGNRDAELCYQKS